MRHVQIILILTLAACAPTPEPAPVRVSDPDGFLFFNDAALYRSAMRRCAARLPGFAPEKAKADTVFASAAERYRAKGGNPERRDLARLFAQTDTAMGRDLDRAGGDVETACARLRDYHAGNVRRYMEG